MNRDDATTIVVIGANSFSGQDFVDLLLENRRYLVIGISRSAERSRLFLRYKSRDDLTRYRYYQIDMNRQMSSLLDLLDAERPDYIVNFAAQSEVGPSWDYPEDWFQTNTVALARLVGHISHQDYLKRYLHISSPEVYGSYAGIAREDRALRPSTPYAASKAAADLLLSVYAKQCGLPLLTVRSTNVYGARQQLFKLIPRAVIYLKLRRLIPLHGGGRSIKSYIHVRDVSRGELAILERGSIGSIYHLSPDKGIAVRDVVVKICALLNVPYQEATQVIAERPGQDPSYVIDSGRARKHLDWAPRVRLDEGLIEVVQWVEENWQEILAQPLEYVHRP